MRLFGRIWYMYVLLLGRQSDSKLVSSEKIPVVNGTVIFSYELGPFLGFKILTFNFFWVEGVWGFRKMNIYWGMKKMRKRPFFGVNNPIHLGLNLKVKVKWEYFGGLQQKINYFKLSSEINA